MDGAENYGGCFQYTLAHSHLGQQEGFAIFSRLVQGRFVLSVCLKHYSLRYDGAHANSTRLLKTLVTQDDVLCSPHMEKPLDNEH